MPTPEPDASPAADTEERGGFGSLGSVIAALVAAWGAVIASFPLNDNSFFTHLATGRLILDRGSVPTTDPYSFTARGEDWTVQSWLVSVVYAAAERAGGRVGLHAVVVVMLVAASLLIWRLSRPATSIIVRLLIVTSAMFVVTDLWGERPYMVGVIGLGLVWLALEGSFGSWLLVPVIWLWANSHGSFPLATVLVLTVLVGEVLDRRRAHEEVSAAALARELSVLKMTVLGTLSAMIGPLGIEVLTFPLKALTRSDVLAEIVEWQPPAYQTLSERMFLALVLASILTVARRGAWRLTIPAVVFAGAGLYAQRNIVMALVVLVPVLAAGVGRVGSLSSDSRPTLGLPLAVIGWVLAVVIAVSSTGGPVTAFDPYPQHPFAWLAVADAAPSHGAVATQEFAGNFLTVLDGEDSRVFIDDRVDMYPEEVFRDSIALADALPGWPDALDRYDIDIVVWERSEALASVLAASPEWQSVFSDTQWVVACRRGENCGVPRS